MSYKPNLRQPYPNELYHFGILGQKWGVRRFQNADGSYTPAGKKRYSGETGITGLFGKKKKQTEPEKKTLGISEEEKAFTEIVENAGFRKEDEDNIIGRAVTFQKTGFNKKDPFLQLSIDYHGNKDVYGESNPHKALQKADRFAKNSDKIVTKGLNKILEDDDNYEWMVEGYKWKYPGKPVPSKNEMKAFLTPFHIDAFNNTLTVASDIAPGFYTIEFNKDTYEPYRVGFDD